MFIPEDVCNQSPGICADIYWEKTPHPQGWWPNRTPAAAYLTSRCCESYTPEDPPHLHCVDQCGLFLAVTSANASPTRPVCITLSQRSSWWSILARNSLALWGLRLFVSTTWKNTRDILEFHFRSSAPRHSAARITINRCSTFPGGGEVQAS